MRSPRANLTTLGGVPMRRQADDLAWAISGGGRAFGGARRRL